MPRAALALAAAALLTIPAGAAASPCHPTRFHHRSVCVVGHVTRPVLTREQHAWVNAQTVAPRLRRFLEDAVGYWGTHPTDRLTLRFSRAVPNGYGGDETTLDGQALIRIHPTEMPRPTRSIPEPDLVAIAVLVTHEFGHALGHQHTTTGIMAQDPSDSVATAYPYEQWR